MAHTWQSADCSAQEPYDRSWDAAWKGTKAKVLVMLTKTDIHFLPEHFELEVEAVRSGIGELDVFPSICGH